MSITTKQPTKLDYEQSIQGAYNDVNATLSVDGFLTGKVGHKVSLALTTTTIADDTEVYTFEDNGTILYEITIVYTDDSRSLMVSAERTA
jgi:hypothetical protein